MIGAKPSARLQSLDAFRGITIAMMLLVNTASLSSSVHPWLAHAYWNGCTLADWVFPCFLLITGVSLSFSLFKYTGGLQLTWVLWGRLLRRAAVLFVLGMFVSNFWGDAVGSIQMTGVLQRIGVAYLATTLIAIKVPQKAQWGIMVLLLLGYWVAYVALPVAEPPLAEVATHRIGKFGLMSGFGLLTTTAIVLIGYFVGQWLQAELANAKRPTSHQSMTLVLIGVGSLALGKLWSLSLPLNKKLWTSSYALFTVGLALLFLAICYELIEVRGKSHWSQPAQILGLNSIFVFVTSEVAIKLLEKTRIGNETNSPSIYMWINQYIWGRSAETPRAGFLFALVMVFLWWAIAYYLYRHRWKITL